ncbi:helix-turn-helix transcriptional regulator [Brevibacillus centrosporus]|uniref:helix-turn-helix domain-containing protein n=1 Tax=Brevibacillus centrosporus TaxID=54910 RepID=UPI002E1A717B|nr:helix-turn-helix transcriptional regulator [Brevibacillus centrosporus]
MSLGQRLRAKRKEANLTQRYVADKLGVDNTTVSKWESGTYEPDSGNLKELAKLYNTTTDALLGHTGGSSSDMEQRAAAAIPPTIKAWLRADTSGLNEEEQESLAEELKDIFEARKKRILERRKTQQE